MVLVFSGPGPLGFPLFCEKTKTVKEKPEDNLMIKVVRFLAICTISIVAVLSALFLIALCGLPAAAQQTPQVLSNAAANAPIQFDVSRPLAQLLREAPAQQPGLFHSKTEIPLTLLERRLCQ